MTLPDWHNRAPEEAAHFNPAYCGALIFEFVKEYEKSGETGSDFPLPFCALAIAMHPQTRNSLPKSTITGLYPWIEANGVAKVGFAKRVQNLRPYVQEAIRYAVARDVIVIDSMGKLRTGPQKASFTPLFLQSVTSEVRETVSAVKKIARWFSAAGETSSILAAWGLRL